MSKYKTRDSSKIVAGDSARHFARSGGGLGDLADVDLKTTAPVATNALSFDGTKWVPAATWVALTQTQYNALSPPLPNTLYVITGP